MLDFSHPIAVLSDVHGNLEALTAVLAEIQAQQITTVINLGDCVGYGPDPQACLDVLRETCAINLCGNHDYALEHEIHGFNPIAQNTIDVARRLLRPRPQETDPAVLARWEFLRNLLPLYSQGKFEFMHGSPRRPITEYLLPSDVAHNHFKIIDNFAALTGVYAFIGHTHYPGVIEEDHEEFIAADAAYGLSGRRALINVGSVGQPRDADARACYAVLAAGQVTWRRVAYDITAVSQKMSAFAEMGPLLSERLFCGQ
jgi:predicted phosphodiesterase